MTRHIIHFLHLALFSPTKSTFLKALKNNHFVGWPGLSTSNITKFLPLNVPTILDHMDQQRQGTRSTKPKDVHCIANPDDQNKTHQAFLTLSDLPTGRIYTDQTGSFPVVSAQGIKSVMVLNDYDSNSISHRR